MQIKKETLRKAIKLGIGEDELSTMVDLCAPTTHHLGNRRYDNYIFLIEDNIVKDINKQGVKEEVCPDCDDDGDYCLTCRTN